MRKHFTSDEAAQFLRNARMGGILTPDQLRSELRHVEQRPDIGNYAVGASVPNWLVEKLEPSGRLAHNYTVYPTLDNLDTVLLATMQCAVISVPMEFDEPKALLDRLENATRSTAGIAPAMQLTSICCNPAFSESLIDGQQVNDVIAVLATIPTVQDLEMAAGRSSGDANAQRDTTLH